MPPTADEQIQFMVNIQRLLDEGLFTASYKFALLLALAVLSIEQGDDSGAPLELMTDAIAEKFVQYYWRQAVPYATLGEATILQQNTDRQAAIVNMVREARASHGGSLTAAMRDRVGWRRLVRKVARVVREMPLWRLQRIGMEQLNFLYEHQGDDGVIHLLPGIAYCFRKFHALISDLVQGAAAYAEASPAASGAAARCKRGDGSQLGNEYRPTATPLHARHPPLPGLQSLAAAGRLGR